MLKIAEIVAGVFKPAADLIDNLHTSTEEKLEQKVKLLEIQSRTMDKVHEYNTQLLEAQGKIVNSEAQSDHWLTANWRPLTMITFVILIVARFLGYEAEGMSPEEYIMLWDIVYIGLGGYVVGRSAEKGIKTYAAIKKSE